MGKRAPSGSAIDLIHMRGINQAKIAILLACGELKHGRLSSFSDAVSPASLTAVARAARQVIADHLKSDAEQEQEEREKY
jgi:hypothetical protein